MTLKRACAPGQTSFFDAPSPEPLPLHDFGQQVRTVLADTLAAARDAGMDRHAVAAEMNRLSGDDREGREITKRMLDSWSAPSVLDTRFPLEALPLLHRATGNGRLLELLNTACGARALPEEAAIFGEIMIAEMQERAARERKQDLARRLPKGAMEWALREMKRGRR